MPPGGPRHCTDLDDRPNYAIDCSKRLRKSTQKQSQPVRDTDTVYGFLLRSVSSETVAIALCKPHFGNPVQFCISFVLSFGNLCNRSSLLFMAYVFYDFCII